jgi:2-keto-4-pentenoate hydratase/2-oxohepta-3-ene-1,7-dioic acid hydratase in catechol pathway
LTISGFPSSSIRYSKERSKSLLRYSSLPKPATALIGPGTPVTIPRVAQPVAHHIPDYEVELTIVIGKAAKDVPESKALDYVLGYTVGNDVS